MMYSAFMAHAKGLQNARFRHGHTCQDGVIDRSPAYLSWASMIARCRNPKATGYRYYGGRGITVCDSWRIFGNFLADMGERPPGRTLDRWPDREGNYEPGNCRWAGSIEQSRNSAKTKPVIRSDGKRYAAIKDAAEDVRVDYGGIVKCCRGQARTAGGFGWSYQEEVK